MPGLSPSGWARGYHLSNHGRVMVGSRAIGAKGGEEYVVEGGPERGSKVDFQVTGARHHGVLVMTDSGDRGGSRPRISAPPRFLRGNGRPSEPGCADWCSELPPTDG